MNILRRRSTWIRIVLGVILIAPCVVCAIGLSYNAKEEAIDETEELLSAAKKYSTGALPLNDIPSNMWVDEECWSLLQDSMLKSSGVHTTTVTYYNRDDPNYHFRDVDEIFLQVDFSDGRAAFVRFYEGGIQGCAQIRPGKQKQN